MSGEVWIGSSLGILKGVSLNHNQTLNYLPAGVSLSQTDKSMEVVAMCWEHQSRDQLYVGLRDGMVRCFDCQHKYFTAECNLTGGQGVYVGIGKHERTMVTCTDEGALVYWPEGMTKVEVDAGSDLCRMRTCPDTQLLVATGGKENPLKLWDGNRPDAGAVFIAKNVRHDSLNLRVPIWVTALGFVSGSGDQPKLAVGTAHHHVRLYDTRAQRRPVQSMEWGENPVTALSVSPDRRHCLVANSVGDLARIDLRNAKIVNRYKGFAGAVCDVSFASDGATFAACGLDRFLCVYRTESPTLLHRTYLKLQCRCLLYCSDPSSTDKSELDKSRQSKKRKTKCSKTEDEEETGGGEEDSEDDELWKTMECVSEETELKPKRKGKKLRK